VPLVDATASALALLDCLERDDLAGLKAGVRELRRQRVELGRDGLELVEHAVALERPEALGELLRLGASDHVFDLFGRYQLAKAPHIRLVRFDETSNWSQMVD
jgi:hypothetical protein